MSRFRLETFQLIEKHISIEFLNKINEISGNNCCYIKENDYTNIWRFYISGVYVAKKLVKVYKEAIEHIQYFSKYYGNNLKIIFLTSGYEAFIRGVVDEILFENNLSHLNYLVIGSKIEFKKGNVKEVYHIDQFKKQDIIENIIKEGAKIRFLADDSNENEKLYQTVIKNGGIALKIRHIPNQVSNQDWQKSIEEIRSYKVKEKIKNDDSCVKLRQQENILPDFLQRLSKITTFFKMNMRR